MKRSTNHHLTAGRLRRFALATLLAALGAGLASAQDAKVFSIPAEPAAAAVEDLTRQSGLQVFAPAEDLQGVRTNAVQGTYTAMEAARRMLSGTGLEIVQTGENAITIRRPAAHGGQDLQEVVVTGTRIKRAGFDTLEAAIVTSSKQISRRGYTNVLEALQSTPGFGNPGSSSLSDQQGRLGIAQSFANFFSLGSQRTLTLVNGQRFVSSNTVAGAGSNASPGSQVDLNLIPVNLIDHIETIAIGGAPVYGADAIAGTVNIILKDHFQGLEATGQYGESGRGDAQSRMFSVLLGGNFAENRGNAVLSVDYTKQNPLRFSDRYGLLESLPNPADTGPNDGIPSQFFNQNTHFAFMTEGGLPYDGSLLDVPGLHYPGVYPNGNYIFNASGQPVRFDRNGNLVPMSFGTIANSADLGGGASIPLYSSGGDGVNAADHFGLLAGTERFLLNALGHYDILPDVRLFVNASYAHTEAVLPSDLTSIIAPNILNSPSLTFSVDNPYLSSQARDIIAANGLTTFNLARNLNDIVDLTPATSIEDVYRAVAGAQGTFHALGEEMSWNASYNYGNSRTTSSDNYINPDRLLLAADAVRDPSGNIVCASGDPCVPIDLFGENAFSRQAANYVVDHGTGVGINTQEDVNVNLAGGLPLSLGGAEHVQFNIGYEHRLETGNFQPDSALQTGDQLDGVPGYTGIAGEYHTSEVYGETVVPLISDKQGISWVKSTQLEGAVRNVENSVAGRGVTWSAGGRFAPRMGGWGDGLLVRGVFTHAIRDPAITELFLPSSGTLNGITDPCDAGNVSAGPAPDVRLANCTKALAAVGAAAPQSFHSTTETISVAGTQSGNPALTNEVADSWSVGFVYQPRLNPHFRFAVDWSNISLKKGIQSLDINSILESCYDSSNYPENPACSLFSRLTATQAGSPRIAGDIAAGYQQSYINTATLNFDGLISVVQYQTSLGRLGTLDLSATLFYIHRYDSVAFSGQPVTHEAGTIGLPRYDAQLNLGYSWHRFDTEWQILWKSASVLNTVATLEDLPDFTVPSYALLNATVGYQFTDHLRAQLVVNNVLDKRLPIVALEQRAFGLYDPIGRMYLLTVVADL